MGVNTVHTGNGQGKSFGWALAWVLGLSIVLGWLPVIGPLIAGFVGGRAARRVGVALGAALIPAVLWAGMLYGVSHSEFKVGETHIFPGPLGFLAPVTACALLAGALAGAGGRGARSAGAVILTVGLFWFVPKARDVWQVVEQIRSAQAPYEPEKNKTCPENLKQLYNAVMLYADSWDNTLPPAEIWMTAIKENVPKDEWLHCPEVAGAGGEHYGYAMNAALGGKRVSDMKDAAKTPLFYDSTDVKVDAHDAVSSLPKPGRHGGRNNILYLDGHVESVPPG